jgi:hypothetical protein
VANKSYLITIGKLGTAIAFRPDLLGQLFLVDQSEAVFFEKSWLANEAENPGYAQLLGLF